jgi:hypothetical protein
MKKKVSQKVEKTRQKDSAKIETLEDIVAKNTKLK